MNYQEPEIEKEFPKYIEFTMPIEGVDTEVIAKVWENHSIVVCCTEGRWMMYYMSGVPVVFDQRDIQKSLYDQKFQTVLNLMK